MKVRKLLTGTAKNAAKRFVARENGTQLAELAIVLPIILVLFGATAEFGRFFYT
ncbi:MAG: TadE/TadG family type IV pilus assembly protein, partial [Pyrinomonadaceae bacterium]